MKVLVIGSGAREHALAWAIRRSPSVSAVFVAPGNAGTELLARNVAIKADDVAALIEFARREEIDLTVVGPEGPLVLGVVDRFHEVGLAIYGPTAAAARLEGEQGVRERLHAASSHSDGRVRRVRRRERRKEICPRSRGVWW